jgi:protein SCO1/2
VRPGSLWRNPWVWAFVLGCLTLTALRPFLRHVPEPPPVLSRLPEWTLTSQDGRPFGSADLRGQVYVANFFFTSCTSVCPPLMAATRRLDDRLREGSERGILIVSVTVDPERDTPERLRQYAREMRIDTTRWTLLTGERADLVRLLEGGFKVPVGVPETAGASPSLVDIAHSGKLVLVDRQGGIRGYYDSTPMGLDEVFHRARHVRDQTGEGT